MSSYKLAEISGNLLKAESWERIIKYAVVELIVGIVVTLLIFLTLSMFGRVSLCLSMFIILCLIISGHAVMLSWYEKWRGCNLLV